MRMLRVFIVLCLESRMLCGAPFLSIFVTAVIDTVNQSHERWCPVCVV